MAITISAKELMEVVEMTPSSQNIMLVGKHGIGKSKMLTDYFTSKGQKVVTLFLGQMSDPGDLIGLPHKNEATGQTEFMPPYWFPIDGKPIVLFLDELNRARPEILQTIMDLALNRCLAGRRLPEGSRIIAAVNDGDEYQLTDLDPALVSRFNIYSFTPTTTEWLIWAESHDIDSRIVSFIQNNEAMLDPMASAVGESSLEKSPDRRAWERVSDIIKGKDSSSCSLRKIIAGIVGAKATAAFMASIDNEKIISAKELLSSFDAVSDHLLEYEVHTLSILNERVFRHLETISNRTRKMGDNLAKYITWLSAERREAMAHFCALYENNNYSKANVFMMIEQPACFKLITTFLKTL